MDIDKYKSLISHTYLFNTFSTDEISALFKDEYCTIKNYNKNSIIYLQNEICTTIDILLEGKVTIQK